MQPKPKRPKQPIKQQKAESRPAAHFQLSEVTQQTQPEKIRYLASREEQKQFAKDFGSDLVISFPWAR
ncbi:MAG: hypothetical protein EBS61_13545 [Betaproteobacteria bacterium]|nr:hypothetical protein [Betaproteobacteria bacterium]